VATTFCLLNVAKAGDNIVSSTDLYGGTVNLFNHTLSKQGIEIRYADPLDPAEFEKQIDDKTRAIYAETLPNPYLRVFPIQEVSDIGRKYNIPLIIDNTAAPVICNSIEHGAAVVMHSLTKYIGGHGAVIGGVIIDGANFNWTADQNGNRFSMNQIQVKEEWFGAKRFHRLPVITFLLQFEPESVCYVILDHVFFRTMPSR